MSYIKFDKDELINLEYTLSRELLRSNRAGSYSGTSLIGCNTRKYHGLLISPVKDKLHLFLSALDETIIQHGQEFRLGIHKYTGNIYFPHGHKYITEFQSEPVPTQIYQIGGVILKKTPVLVYDQERILIKYTILDAHSATILKLHPFLAFREIHSLSKANMDANTKVLPAKNGIKYKMYDYYPYLYMQTSKKSEFISAPDWNYNNEYDDEKKRGYEHTEDLFVPGFFKIKVKKGDEIIFSAGLSETDTKNLDKLFEHEISNRTPRTNFENNLNNSAQQFFIKNKSGKFITAGYYWYNFKSRESLISIPGLTLARNKADKFKPIFDYYLQKLKISEEKQTVDIPLHIIRTVQQYNSYAESCDEIWENYGKLLIKIFKDIISGKYNATVQDNGMLYIPDNDNTSTWMNETVNGEPVTPRSGYVVEINALWYNALLYLESLTDLYEENKIKIQITEYANKVKYFFEDMFYNHEKNCLFDFVNNQGPNSDIRPNQIFAVSLEYSPLEKETQKQVLKTVIKHLLTPRGLRSLSPQNSKYIGIYEGDEAQRNRAKHQGTVHPWLIGNFCDAYLNVYGTERINYIEEIYQNFEETINEYGIGTISELFDGDSPHTPAGAVSYAPAVAELLRVKNIIEKTKLTI